MAAKIANSPTRIQLKHKDPKSCSGSWIICVSSRPKECRTHNRAVVYRLRRIDEVTLKFEDAKPAQSPPRADPHIIQPSLIRQRIVVPCDVVRHAGRNQFGLANNGVGSNTTRIAEIQPSDILNQALPKSASSGLEGMRSV